MKVKNLVPGPDPSTKFLSAVEEDFPPIVLWPHGEVDPIRGAALLLDELIKNPAVFISRIEQESSIADHLLQSITMDIHRATLPHHHCLGECLCLNPEEERL